MGSYEGIAAMPSVARPPARDQVQFHECMQTDDCPPAGDRQRKPKQVNGRGLN